MDTQQRKNELQYESQSFEYNINESIQDFINNKHTSSFEEKSSSFDHKLEKLILYEDLFETDSNTNSSKNSLDPIQDDGTLNSVNLEASNKFTDEGIKIANLTTDVNNFSESSLVDGSYQPLKVEPNPKAVKCNECGKYVLKSSLKVHVRSHSGEKPFECDVCNKSFTVKCNLRDHQLTHNLNRPIHCPDCSLRFKTENLMQVHVKTVHSELKPFSCEKCHVKFKLKRNLQVHIMKIHAVEKPYKCTSCDYATSHRSCLETHFWTHTNIKRFHCEKCDKFFTQRAKLQDHINIHNNIRPFSCKHCNKAFNRKDNLKVHLRSHLGTKPYKCDVCSKLFSSSQGLNYHMKKQNHKHSKGEIKLWDEVSMKPNMISVQSMTSYTAIQEKKHKMSSNVLLTT